MLFSEHPLTVNYTECFQIEELLSIAPRRSNGSWSTPVKFYSINFDVDVSFTKASQPNKNSCSQMTQLILKLQCFFFVLFRTIMALDRILFFIIFESPCLLWNESGADYRCIFHSLESF